MGFLSFPLNAQLEIYLPRGFPPNTDFYAPAVAVDGVRDSPTSQPTTSMETQLRTSGNADTTKSSVISPQITTAPSQERVELLLKRQDGPGPTCGYISGDTGGFINPIAWIRYMPASESCLTRSPSTASPMTCRRGFSCTVGSTWGEFGCCNQVECDASYYEACVDPVNNRCLVGGMDFGVGCDIYSKVLSW